MYTPTGRSVASRSLDHINAYTEGVSHGKRASDRAYATLLDEIQSGSLAPGTVLGEAEQAARLGVSRTPLREAIARLASHGLVTQVSPRVTTVSGIDADDIRAIFDVRRALEETAARLAARTADRSVFDALAEDFAATQTSGGPASDADAYYRLIGRFDAELDAAVDNDYLTSALGPSVRTSCASVASPATSPSG